MTSCAKLILLQKKGSRKSFEINQHVHIKVSNILEKEFFFLVKFVHLETNCSISPTLWQIILTIEPRSTPNERLSFGWLALPKQLMWTLEQGRTHKWPWLGPHKRTQEDHRRTPLDTSWTFSSLNFNVLLNILCFIRV